MQYVFIVSMIANHTVKASSWFKRQKIVWSLLLVEYYTHLACSILLILKEAHNPKYVGSLGPYLVVFLVAIEIVAPLLSPMIEEFVVH